MMRKMMCMAILVVTIIGNASATVSAASLAKRPEIVSVAKETKEKTTDYQLMKKTVRKHYPGKKIKIVDGNGSEEKYWSVVLKRKNKKYVVVEKVVSTGNGTKHGWYKTADGNRYIIGYNRKVPKGKKVTSYVIWNPENNECDDVTYVVDNGKVR